ncbi:hypothetical protein V8E53_003071 [Lactarius tabidus]
MAPSTATVISSDDEKAYLTLLHKATIAVIHEVTLQDLLHCSNDAFIHILWECNNLLRERGDKDNGYVLQCRATRPHGAWYPKDRRYIDTSVQTDDPDSTLAEIDPDVLIEDCNVLNCEECM